LGMSCHPKHAEDPAPPTLQSCCSRPSESPMVNRPRLQHSIACKLSLETGSTTPAGDQAGDSIAVLEMAQQCDYRVCEMIRESRSRWRESRGGRIRL
jgi:hypothetical protein